MARAELSGFRSGTATQVVTLCKYIGYSEQLSLLPGFSCPMGRGGPAKPLGNFQSEKGRITYAPEEWFSGFSALALVALLNGCANNSSSSGNPNPQSSSVFVTGTDAPLPGVVGFRVASPARSVME